MTGLVRKATLLSAGGLLIAGAAMAGIPFAANCTIGGQSFGYLGDGTFSAVAGANPCNRITSWDAAVNVQAPLSGLGGQLIEIRDEANNPVPFAQVAFEALLTPFVSDGVGINTGTCPDGDIEFCANSQADAWTGGAPLSDGPGERVGFSANGAGQLFVTIIGNGPNFNCGGGTPSTTCAQDDPAAVSRPRCVNIIAGGTVVLGRVIVTNARMNLNNTGGSVGLVNASDVSEWLSCRAAYSGGATQTTPNNTFLGGYNSNCDYSANGVVDAFDVALLSAGVLAAASTPGTGCVVIP